MPALFANCCHSKIELKAEDESEFEEDKRRVSRRNQASLNMEEINCRKLPTLIALLLLLLDESEFEEGKRRILKKED